MRKYRPKGAARTAFLGCIEDISAAVNKGLTLKAVHEGYAGVMSYAQFTRLVRAYIRGDRPYQRLLPLPLPPVAKRPPAARHAEPAAPMEESGNRKFVFDPTAVDRKDLI
jgi:hypothetical protein